MTNGDGDPPNRDADLELLLDAVAPIAPPPELRQRLLASAHGRARYWPFAQTMSRIFDVDLDRARELLTTATDPSTWRPGRPPFVAHLDFSTGPAAAGLRAGLVSMEGGAVIPRHRHTEREVTLVLGGAILSDGRRLGPGEVLDMAVGTEHVFEVADGGAVFAVLRGRTEFLG